MKTIPQALLEEWRQFDELDPDMLYRLDWGIAHIVQAIMRDGKPLREFMLQMGDYVRPVAVEQSIAYQEKMIDAWIFSSNAVFAAKQRGRA